MPDWLPALVNAGRAFVVISAAELFWIVTAWPNGASAVAWAAIGVILLALRADHAYDAAIVYMLGTGLAVAFAALVKFAVLPQVVTYFGFSIIIGLLPRAYGRTDCPADGRNFVPLPGAAALRARGSIVAMSEALSQHAVYFDAAGFR